MGKKKGMCFGWIPLGDASVSCWVEIYDIVYAPYTIMYRVIEVVDYFRHGCDISWPRFGFVPFDTRNDHFACLLDSIFKSDQSPQVVFFVEKKNVRYEGGRWQYSMFY